MPQATPPAAGSVVVLAAGAAVLAARGRTSLLVAAHHPGWRRRRDVNLGLRVAKKAVAGIKPEELKTPTKGTSVTPPGPTGGLPARKPNAPEAKKPEESQPSSKDDRLDKMKAAMKKINKDAGEEVIRMLGSTALQASGKTFSTGVLSLDLAMGGGWPCGRIVEIYGPEASGKTTLALHAMVEAAKLGGVAFIDVEHALDRGYAERIGVDFNRVAFVQPDSAEGAIDMVEDLVKSEGVSLVVVDSVAALVPLEEVAKDMEQASIGLTARLMSKAMRKLTPVASKTGCTVMFINQLRATIGGYGLQEVTSGGKALKYAASVRLEVRAPKSGLLKHPGQDTPYGTSAYAKVVKNKVFPPHKEAHFDIIYGKGVSKEVSVFQAAVECGVIVKAGAWFTYNGMRHQGKEKFTAALQEDSKLCKQMEEAVTKYSKAAAANEIVAKEEEEEKEEE